MEKLIDWKENRSELQMSGMQALHTIPYHGMQAGALCIPSEEKACIRGPSVKSRDWVLERRDEFCLGCLGHNSVFAVRGLLSTLPVGSGPH